MLHKSNAIPSMALLLALLAPLHSVHAAEPANSPVMLKGYVEELKKYPEDNDLRRTIIKLAQTLKSKPAVPEEAERALARGAAYMNTATDISGYNKAIVEFQAALRSAPWWADGYLNLGLAQEKAGLYAEAVQSLKFYTLAEPKAKDSREVKNKIYTLEVYVEEATKAPKTPQASQAPPVVQTPATPPKAPQAAQIPAPPPKTPQPVQATQDDKVKQQGFEGNWFFKDTGPRREEIIYHAFAISKGPTGELVAAPPKRSAESVGTITSFEASGKKLKLQLNWKHTNNPGYWKTEDYDLTLSADETKLTGTYTQRSSSGTRHLSEDKVLFRK